jgi:hypothetical protein
MRGLSNRIRKIEEKSNRQREPTTNRTATYDRLFGPPGDLNLVGIPKAAPGSKGLRIMIVHSFGNSLEEWEQEAISQQNGLLMASNKGETQ